MDKLIKIEAQVAGNNQRLLSHAQLEADPALVAEGWERRFSADEHRAKEAMELYSKVGYEVRAEPLRPEETHEDCEDCRTVAALQFLTIYTRKK